MAFSAPPGPLQGSELSRAIRDLTDNQLRAYRYFREGQHTIGWIAQRMGVSRAAVQQQIRKAEKRLGYEATYRPRQKGRYRTVAERRDEAEMGRVREAERAFSRMSPQQRHKFIRRVVPNAPREITEKTELRYLAKILTGAVDDPDARERLRARLTQLEAPRRRRHDDHSQAVGGERAEFDAMMEADFGAHPFTGDPIRPLDLPL
jgi:DNA-binding CsgD family transcriptional regulator